MYRRCWRCRTMHAKHTRYCTQAHGEHCQRIGHSKCGLTLPLAPATRTAPACFGRERPTSGIRPSTRTQSKSLNINVMYHPWDHDRRLCPLCPEPFPSPPQLRPGRQTHLHLHPALPDPSTTPPSGPTRMHHGSSHFERPQHCTQPAGHPCREHALCPRDRPCRPCPAMRRPAPSPQVRCHRCRR